MVAFGAAPFPSTRSCPLLSSARLTVTAAAAFPAPTPNATIAAATIAIRRSPCRVPPIFISSLLDRYLLLTTAPACRISVVLASGSITSMSAPSAELPAHVALAVVFEIRAGELQVLLWQRGREPFTGAWSLPGGEVDPRETLEQSTLRHLATKVDVREVAHLEQLGTWSDPRRHPAFRELATAYLGLVPLGVDPRVPPDTAWHPVDALPRTAFDHGEIVLA